MPFCCLAVGFNLQTTAVFSKKNFCPCFLTQSLIESRYLKGVFS
ncbi:hypothetical protein SGRA_0298 [Saprospira grandis str. Lewin]|uniref:Uncharacterized protein n=1 Tax=Saprospira grandis (strain Lewin) TaxID=984262 RepID=H6L7K5_SAPGL|nr:hypothetical protein SGRA_0298 [Saprospira grandis str. Lewin]